LLHLLLQILCMRVCVRLYLCLCDSVRWCLLDTFEALPFPLRSMSNAYFWSQPQKENIQEKREDEGKECGKAKRG